MRLSDEDFAYDIGLRWRAGLRIVSPVKTRRNLSDGDMSLVGAGEGANPTSNHAFLITFDLA